MKKIILGFLLFFANYSFSQTLDTIWFNNKWEKTDRAHRYYYRVMKFDAVNNNYLVTDYYPSGKTQMMGTFTSITPEVRDGLFTYYFADGTKQKEELFDNSLVISYAEWDKTGKLKSNFKGAHFPGGTIKLLTYIVKHTKYPKQARRLGVTGRVLVNFKIDTTGRVDSVIIPKSIHPLLDEEAIRVVKAMPRWIPAESDGKKITFYYTIPISFKFEE